MTEEMLEGGCACGEIRYRMPSSPLFVHCCHCRSCQRETGTAFALNALVEANRVEILAGSPEAVLTPSESGKGQTIVRCPTCRVAVWSHYGGFGDPINFMRVGTLDDPDRLSPDVHIYTRSKQPWVQIPEGATTAETFYDLKELWPAESRARLRSLYERKS
jgi:hypothetical protein